MSCLWWASLWAQTIRQPAVKPAKRKSPWIVFSFGGKGIWHPIKAPAEVTTHEIHVFSGFHAPATYHPHTQKTQVFFPQAHPGCTLSFPFRSMSRKKKEKNYKLWAYIGAKSSNIDFGLHKILLRVQPKEEWKAEERKVQEFPVWPQFPHLSLAGHCVLWGWLCSLPCSEWLAENGQVPLQAKKSAQRKAMRHCVKGRLCHLCPLFVGEAESTEKLFHSL